MATDVTRRSEAGSARVVLVAAAAVVAALLAWRVAALRSEVGQLARELALLRAEQRTVASLALMEPSRRGPDPEQVARAAPENAGSLAAKPLDKAQDVEERARRVGDDAIARALEHAASLPTFDPVPPTEAPTAPLDSEPAPAETDPEAKPQELDALIDAMNQLLRDAGLQCWSVLAATPRPEERALAAVVLAHRSERGTAIGSLSADRLTLERDPVSGAARFVLTGAKGSEEGIEVAYENSTTRLEIPGILPLDLLTPGLRALFGLGDAVAAASDEANGEQLVRAINRVLALEKNVGLRFRTVDRLEQSRLKKAVIDLAFDERGDPTQTVLADEAWFELDAEKGYGELCCEGGEMVEKGLKRPLYRGRLRLPLRDIQPAQWRAVPASHPSGS